MSMTKLIDGVAVQMSAQEIEEHEALMASLAIDQWKSNRASAYPSIQEQLDMQYWDSVNGTTTWADAIAKVKADYLKGAE